MRCEGHGLTRHAFLQTAVTGESDDVIVDDLVLSGVVLCRRHFAGERVAHRIADALTQRARGGLHAGGFMELRMPRGDGMQRAEFGDVFDRHRVAAEVQPGVEEHGAMAGAENEAVTVQPFGVGGIALEGFAKEDGTDFGTTEGETEMAGGALVYGIHGETTGFVGSLSEEGVVHVERFWVSEGRDMRQMRPSAGRLPYR